MYLWQQTVASTVAGVFVVDLVDDQDENVMEVAVERIQLEIVEENDDDNAGDDDILVVFGMSLAQRSRWC